MLSFLVLIIGFTFLIKGADLFVDGASSVAKRFNISPIIIGLTIVAMGTSLPEMAVSVVSSVAGQNDMSVANVVGSNFFNILCVLGISSLIKEIPIDNITKKRDMPMLLSVSAWFLAFGTSNLTIGRIEGIVFLAIFAYFIFSMIKQAKKDGEELSNNECQDDNSLLKALLLGIIGMIGIGVGGQLVVDSASSIAISLGMSEGLVGLTIVAIGTSLPELVTSLVAIKKDETAIGIGNVIGSNIFNILFVLGIATVISPVTISMSVLVDIIFMVIITFVLFLFVRRNKITKKQGIIMIMTYLIYMLYTIVR